MLTCVCSAQLFMHRFSLWSLWLCLVQVMMLCCLWAITSVARSWLQMRNMYAAPVWLILYDERIFYRLYWCNHDLATEVCTPCDSTVHWYCTARIVVVWRKILWIPLHDPHTAEYCTLWLWLINPTDRGPLAHCYLSVHSCIHHLYTHAFIFYTHMTIVSLYSITTAVLFLIVLGTLF